jgi:hypothetical protein
MNAPAFVIPANAGTQSALRRGPLPGPRFRGGDEREGGS